MTSGNPFEKEPSFSNESSDPNVTPSPESSPEKGAADEIQRTKAPRKVLKNLTGLVVPIFGVGVLAWLFLADGKPAHQKEPLAPTKQTEINTSKQLNDTSNLLTDLKADATNTPVAEVPVQTPAAKPVRPMRAIQFDPAEAERDNALAEQKKRREEILASPLEAQGGNFKMMGGSEAAPPVGGTVKDRLGALQADMDGIAQRRDATLRANSPERLLDALGKQMNAPTDAEPRRQTNEEFLTSQGAASRQNTVVRQQARASTLLVNQGSVIRAVLLTGVKSDLPGRITAQVTANVYDSIFQRHVLIPKHSRLIGTFSTQVVAGQDRLLIAMNRLILPDGSWISLGGASGSDLIGQSGIEAEVNNHFLKMFGSSLVIGAASLLLPSSDRQITTTSGINGTQQGGTIIGMALNDTLKALLNRNRSISPTLTLQPGEEFLFLAAHDIEMKPYKEPAE